LFALQLEPDRALQRAALFRLCFYCSELA